MADQFRKAQGCSWPDHSRVFTAEPFFPFTQLRTSKVQVVCNGTPQEAAFGEVKICCLPAPRSSPDMNFVPPAVSGKTGHFHEQPPVRCASTDPLLRNVIETTYGALSPDNATLTTSTAGGGTSTFAFCDVDVRAVADGLTEGVASAPGEEGAGESPHANENSRLISKAAVFKPASLHRLGVWGEVSCTTCFIENLRGAGVRRACEGREKLLKTRRSLFAECVRVNEMRVDSLAV